MKRNKFVPQIGGVYRNNGGGEYACVAVIDSHEAVMRNRASGWTLNAHGIGIYEDGSIDWDYSTNGHFAEKED